jgi:hypothetical protein
MSVSGKPDPVDALLDEAERKLFVGWDFSWLRGRLDSQPHPCRFDVATRPRTGYRGDGPELRGRWGAQRIAAADAPLSSRR